MPNASNEPGDRPLRVGSLLSGYGGLDLAVEKVFNARTVWVSEVDEPVARVLAHHGPDAPNLGDITAIDWSSVGLVDVLCGGFPCQDVSTVGKMAGLKPGTHSGLWAHMATAIDKLKPEWVVIENVRGLLSAPAVRPSSQGDDTDRSNPSAATPDDATLRSVASDPWHLGDKPARPLRALGAVLGDLADLRTTRNGSAYPPPLSALRIRGIGFSFSPGALFRTPLASDSMRGKEPIERVRARRGAITLSHQVAELVEQRGRDHSPEGTFALIEEFFNAGDATPQPSPGGNISPDGRPPLPRS